MPLAQGCQGACSLLLQHTKPWRAAYPAATDGVCLKRPCVGDAIREADAAISAQVPALPVPLVHLAAGEHSTTLAMTEASSISAALILCQGGLHHWR